MAFNSQELESIANSALDFYFNRGDAFKQSIQSKPLLELMERKKKSFPGGQGDIVVNVKGDFGFPVNTTTGAPVPTPTGGSDTLVGYTHDDTVTFYTPANIRKANFPWREHHIGLTLTHTELKIDGISVTDTNGEGTRNHSRREMTALVNIFEEKLNDLGEQYARGMNRLLWGDGTGDAKALAGLQSMITANPTTGTVSGERVRSPVHVVMGAPRPRSVTASTRSSTVETTSGSGRASSGSLTTSSSAEASTASPRGRK